VKAMLLLVGGAVVNVAVAWLGNLEWLRTPLSRSAQFTKGGLFTPSGEWLGFVQADGLLVTELSWSAGLPDPKLDQVRQRRLRSAPTWSIVPSLSGYQAPGIEGHSSHLEHKEMASGFPTAGMHWCCQLSGGNFTPMTPAIRLDPASRRARFGLAPRILPLRLIWPGFAINTVFYAAILWMLFAAPFSIRRWRRIKRGLCPACAYPVGASDVCTECGKPVKRAMLKREVMT
jgi:hypothetical protein